MDVTAPRPPPQGSEERRSTVLIVTSAATGSALSPSNRSPKAPLPIGSCDARNSRPLHGLPSDFAQLGSLRRWVASREPAEHRTQLDRLAVNQGNFTKIYDGQNTIGVLDPGTLRPDPNHPITGTHPPQARPLHRCIRVVPARQLPLHPTHQPTSNLQRMEIESRRQVYRSIGESHEVAVPQLPEVRHRIAIALEPRPTDVVTGTTGPAQSHIRW